MSECEKYRELLSTRIDGELEASENAEVEKHIGECKDCRSYVHILEMIADCAPELFVDPPESLAKGIMYKIGLENKESFSKRFFGRRQFSLIGLAAAVVLIVASGRFSGLFNEVPQESYAEHDRASMTIAGGIMDASIHADVSDSGEVTMESNLENAVKSRAQAYAAETESALMFAGDTNVTYIGVNELPDIPQAQNYSTVVVIGENDVTDALKIYEREESGAYAYYVIPIEEYDSLCSEWSGYELCYDMAEGEQIEDKIFVIVSDQK